MPLGKVSGSVVDGNGQPFPSSGVATCPAPSVPSAPTFCPGLQTATADAAGNYTLRLGAGTYNAVGFDIRGGLANAIAGAPKSITIAAGQTLHCDVQMPGAPVCGGDDDGVNNAVENGGRTAATATTTARKTRNRTM